MVTQFNVGFDEAGVHVHHHMPGEDGVYAKEVQIPAGVELKTHAHSFTHKSILAAGRVVVKAGGVSQTVVAPAVLTLVRGVEHTVAALVDSTWFCIHATDEQDPEKIDQALTKEA
jgi:quercetin dioxygenase-like cupin family protein